MHTAGIGDTLYMAPEVQTGQYDHRADIYSLGIILFELIMPSETQQQREEAIDKLRNTSFPKDVDPTIEKEVNSEQNVYNS